MKYMAWFFLSWIFLAPSKASELGDYPDLIILSMNVCYEHENKWGIDLAKCMLDKVKQVPNPEEYKVKITSEAENKITPAPLSLLIYNKAGLIIQCQGMTGAKITLTQCEKKQGLPLTPGQELSLEPPLK